MNIGIVLIFVLVIAIFLFTRSVDPIEYVPEIGGHSVQPIYRGERKNVTLYVYESVTVSSRKWQSFMDRRHKDAKSPFLKLCDTSHQKHHTIGPIQTVTDEDLMLLLEEEYHQKASGLRGAISLQHDRMLRDTLLLRFVCKHGGICIPRNTILYENSAHIWEQVSLGGETRIGYGGDGNSEYGPPIFVSTGGGACEEFVKILLPEVTKREFNGGIAFGGGLPVVLDRCVREGGGGGGSVLIPLNGIVEMNTAELVEMGEYQKGGLVIRVPFPQGAGKTQISRRDEWLYVVDLETMLENPSRLQDIMVKTLAG
jgi:hypothetical protein